MTARTYSDAEHVEAEELRDELAALRAAHRERLQQIADMAAGCKHCAHPAACPVWRNIMEGK